MRSMRSCSTSAWTSTTHAGPAAGTLNGFTRIPRIASSRLFPSLTCRLRRIHRRHHLASSIRSHGTGAVAPRPCGARQRWAPTEQLTPSRRRPAARPGPDAAAIAGSTGEHQSRPRCSPHVQSVRARSLPWVFAIRRSRHLRRNPAKRRDCAGPPIEAGEDPGRPEERKNDDRVLQCPASIHERVLPAPPRTHPATTHHQQGRP